MTEPYQLPATNWATFAQRLQSPAQYTLHVTRTPTDPQPGSHAVVLLHGLGASSWSWHGVVDAAPAGFSTACVDLLGHGQSPKPRHRAYSVYDHARHVIHAIEALGVNRVSLVGNSLGGGCALLAATWLQERGHINVEHLVSLEGIGVRQSTPLPFYLARVPVLPELFKRFTPAEHITRSALRTCYYNPRRITDEQVAAYAAPARDPAQPVAVINSARYVKPTDIDDLPNKYRQMDAPTLLIWGARGNIVPLSVGETLRDILPNAKLTLVDDCGHIPHEERPDLVIPMLWQFLQKTS